VVLPPFLDDLREFFHAIPQDEERSTSIRICALSTNLRVEQNQLDLQECLKFHHPSSSDDEDDADGTVPLPDDV
jgi:hypothetical protein